MKKDIHPKLYKNTVVTCACGNTFVTQSTSESINIDICNNCHPFFTGQQKYVDTEGRIEKFEKKLKVSKERAKEKTKTKKEKSKDKESNKLSLKKLLEESRKSAESQ